MTVNYTTKLGLAKADLGDEVGAWHTLWNDNQDIIEAAVACNYAGDPNGNVAGYWIGQNCYDTSNGIMYTCTTAGNAASAVWTKKLAHLAVAQAWDADAAQSLDGTHDYGSLDALGSDTLTPALGIVGELDADVDGTIAAPSSGYGVAIVHIYNNGTRSLTLSGFPTDALNGRTLSGTDTKIDILVIERSSVNGSNVINHWIYNRA